MSDRYVRFSLLPMITVRRIRSSEADVYREVRLAALEDSPFAFSSTLTTERGYEPAVWEERTRSAASGSRSVIFLALGDRPLGMVAALQNTSDETVAELVSMWVAPSGRGHGVGATLVARAIEWATESGYRRVELWVTRGNESAEHLYRRLGFEVTGDAKPLPSDPCKDEIRMRLEL